LSGLLKRLFDVPPREISFERRGFRGGGPAARARLEQAGGAFIAGYRAALEDARDEVMVPKLEAVNREFRGFAFEGAAMGLALRDWLTPWRRDRVGKFLRGPGDAHAYMVHVGAGWMLARVPMNAERFMARFDPLLRWLAIDGYGFHEGFFHWRRYLSGQSLPARLKGYARSAFDQGLGRSLWFVDGADVERIPKTIAALSAERHADLWSGVGLACVYAGEAEDSALKQLCEAAGRHLPQLAQGAAFAVKARQRAGNPTPYTDRACRIVCDMSAEEAALLTDAALENLPADAATPAYAIWRHRIQGKFGLALGQKQ
jgi:hypothetical protein